MSDAAGVTDTSSEVMKHDFLPVWLSSLQMNTITGFDIYILPEGSRHPVLYREKHLPFSEEARQRLLETGTTKVFVRSSDSKAYRLYVEQNIGSILADPDIPTSTKSEVLYVSATGLVQDVLAEPRAANVVSRSNAFVESTCAFMMNDRKALECLLRVTSFDYYTYTHSVNVFVFSVSLAQRLGMDAQTLEEFGRGTLLHDIGKSMLDPATVNSRGKLTDEQWKEMKMHPVYGEDILKEQGVTSPLILDVVRHHHEKIRGWGYPDGRSGNEITEYARICTIADIFDALTTQRSYKPALRSFPALQMMKGEMLGDLDQDFFRVFVDMMGNPSGE